MQDKPIYVEAEFASPETWYENIPIVAGPVRGEVECNLEEIKEKLLHSVKVQQDRSVMQWLRWAANEAAAAAWLTPFPTLVLPALFEEKVQSVFNRLERQKQILLRCTGGEAPVFRAQETVRC